jgi:hypothetical protein
VVAVRGSVGDTVGGGQVRGCSASQVAALRAPIRLARGAQRAAVAVDAAPARRRIRLGKAA